MSSGYEVILVRIKACESAHVALMTTWNDPDGGMYLIVFGDEGNTKVTFR